MPRPSSGDYAPYHENYVAQITEDDLISALETDRVRLLSLLSDLPHEVALALHAPYTWSIKQVMGHVIDAERIFAYRALRIARGDTTPLPGFEENDYALSGDFDRLPLSKLLHEFDLVRQSSIALFENLPPNAWNCRGIVNNHELSVNGIGYILAGHVRHHLHVLTHRLGL